MKKLITVFALCFVSMLFSHSVYAEVRIAVLDFELKDVTLLPNRPEEIERTASIKPLLTAELQKAGFIILPVESSAQQALNMGEDYLFDHVDVAAQLGKKAGIDSLSVETKGGEKKLTAKAVTMLADKITAVLQSK